MANEYFSKMEALIDSWQGEMIDMLRGWIAVPSIATHESDAEPGKPFGEECRKVLDIALADAQKLGFEVDNVDGYAGAVQFGSGEKTMGMLCHLDVVPAGEGWAYPPFELTVADGKMIGRGTMDDKGPALAALFAMRAVRDSGLKMKDGVRLILGCDEESGMQDMRYYAKHRQMPDYGFSPDAEFPVINIEKGGLSIKLSKRTGGEEGAQIPVYELYAGVAPNVVPGKAHAIVGVQNIGLAELERLCGEMCADGVTQLNVTDAGDGRAKIEAVGRSAHASMPHLGINAAGMLLIALDKLGAGGGSKDAIHLLAEKIGLRGDGSGLGLACADEESGELTSNLGILRYDGDELIAFLDNRVPICGDAATLLGNCTLAVAPAGVAVSTRGYKGPHHVPADSPIVQGLLAAYHEVTDLPAYAFAIGGGTYSRMMPNTVAFGFNFPGDADPCHMPDESVNIAKFVMSVKIFAHAIARLAGCIED
ncbi:MAG: Sapep family Mn(2+)-dependent dipeptidase [Eubacteriales bacterium]|nr:Sapep family Mn(2+)-dependent dipeptidase [Eubacteriales bacterium]